MPNKKPNCVHQWDYEPNCQPAFLNYYKCAVCGTEWEDEWSCGCNDHCPGCDAEVEAKKRQLSRLARADI
jgi:hypothetical protein